MSSSPIASSKLNRDKLLMLPRSEGLRFAHLALHGVQDERPEAILAGIAILFAGVCQRCMMDPQDMHRLGLRFLRSSEGDQRTNESAEVLRDFTGLRIMGHDVTIG